MFTSTANSQDGDLFNNFTEGWQKEWKKKSFTRKKSAIEVIEEENNKALKIISDNTATGFWRNLNILPQANKKLTWKWKTKKFLDNSAEMEKKGDDYVGRIYVAFGNQSLLSKFRTKVICYVWASEGTIEQSYSSPYAKNVKIVVIRNKNNRTKTWYQESRAIFEDYKRLFGAEPPPVSAIGILADTDNSNMMCTTWFEDLKFEN